MSPFTQTVANHSYEDVTLREEDAGKIGEREEGGNVRVKRRREVISTEIEFMCWEEWEEEEEAEEVGLKGKEWVEGVALWGRGGGQGRLRQSIKL